MRRVGLVAACAVALLVSIALGVSFGSGSATALDLLTPGTRAHDIVVGYRLPRVLIGAVAGAGLAAVGASFQAVLRNPLAEPYILGVSGGAALGATLALAGGAAGVGILAAAGVPVAAFAGAVAATGIVWALVRAGRGGSAPRPTAEAPAGQPAPADGHQPAPAPSPSPAPA